MLNPKSLLGKYQYQGDSKNTPTDTRNGSDKTDNIKHCMVGVLDNDSNKTKPSMENCNVSAEPPFSTAHLSMASVRSAADPCHSPGTAACSGGELDHRTGRHGPAFSRGILHIPAVDLAALDAPVPVV